MNNLVKLLIPLGLGVVAAAVNWFVLQEKTAPGVFLKVKEDVRAGGRFTADVLERMEIPGASEELRQTAVPYPHKAVLFNSPSLRDLKKGDLVLWRDVNPQLQPGEDQLPIALDGISVVHPRLLVVGNEVTFIVDRNGVKSANGGSSSSANKNADARLDPSYIGPFRIVTVDGQVAQPDKGSSRGGQRLITVAIRLKEDKTRQLLEALKAHKEGQKRFVEMMLNAPAKP